MFLNVTKLNSTLQMNPYMWRTYYLISTILITLPIHWLVQTDKWFLSLITHLLGNSWIDEVANRSCCFCLLFSFANHFFLCPTWCWSFLLKSTARDSFRQNTVSCMAEPDKLAHLGHFINCWDIYEVHVLRKLRPCSTSHYKLTLPVRNIL